MNDSVAKGLVVNKLSFIRDGVAKGPVVNKLTFLSYGVANGLLVVKTAKLFTMSSQSIWSLVGDTAAADDSDITPILNMNSHPLKFSSLRLLWMMKMKMKIWLLLTRPRSQ